MISLRGLSYIKWDHSETRINWPGFIDGVSFGSGVRIFLSYFLGYPVSNTTP